MCESASVDILKDEKFNFNFISLRKASLKKKKMKKCEL